MKKPGQQARTPTSRSPGPEARAAVAKSEDAAARRRWFRLTAVLVVPLACLLLLEGALRLLGYGYPTAFFVRHPAAGPDVLVENQRFAWRFVPRTLAKNPEFTVLAPAKPAGAFRIFVFGESAAIGDPAPAFSFARILEVLLRARYPNTRFEVVNTAFTAINSHVILPIARDCQGLQGDFWLVYLGNNEVIGPYGCGTVFGQQTPPLPVIRASLALRTTRTGQWLDALLRRLRPSREAALGWGGMSMFLNQQVRRDDPRLAVLGRHFQRNLEDVINLGTRAGGRVVVSTMVSRVRDWPPFGSLHGLGLSEADRLAFEQLFQSGATAEAGGDFATAARDYESAARIDETYAALHFRWGTCALALGQTNEARSHFTLARDLDTLRFRTDSHLNDLIRRTVGAHTNAGVRLLEAERAFEQRSPNGIPGEEFLYEHVHFTFAGNYLLARLFADELATLLPASVSLDAVGQAGWLSPEACAARLGYTDSQRYEIANVIRRRFDEPIYRQQLGYAERVKRVDQELNDLRGYAKPVARRRAFEVCRQALAASPDDWVLHELTARLLLGLDDYAAAEAEWREVARLVPHAARPHSEIGELQLHQGKADEALRSFTKALEVNPDCAEAHIGLGHVYRRQGSGTEAARHFRLALRLDPTKTEAAEELKRMLQSERRPSPRLN